MVGDFRRTIAGRIASLAGSIIVLGLLVYWISLYVNSKAADVASARNIIHNNSQLIQGLASVKSTAPEIGKYKKALDILLPMKDELVTVSGWLDGLSRAHQISQHFSFQENVVESSKSEAGSAGFSLSASGAYDNLINFLNDVEFKAPRYLVSFDNFDFNREDARYHVLVRGRIFFR